MPIFTKISWETLYEASLRDSYKSGFNSQQQEHCCKSSPIAGNGENGDGEEEKKKKMVGAPKHLYITPALYATPEPTPIPDSSSEPSSPSPYVLNHKRRRLPDDLSSSNSNSNGDRDDVCVGGVNDDSVGGEGENGGSVAEDEEFLDPTCDLISVASSTEMDDFGRRAETGSLVSNQCEFFDVNEDLFSDGSISNLSSSYASRIESEQLQTISLSLLEEIERREAAEYEVDQMRSQWERLCNLLQQTGVVFPSFPEASSIKLEIDLLEQLCQELVVTRFVSEAVGRAEGRAEAEMAAEVVIKSKDQEIARLQDKLQYYEAAIHEMSQRNQEVVGAARKQRQRRRRSRQRWLWGCLGLSLAVGAAFIARSQWQIHIRGNVSPLKSEN
ncbi:hypothetical protein NMG60_11036584 [Bertholletia excelsa]